MTERLLTEEYLLRGDDYKLYVDNDRNWWLVYADGGTQALSEKDFDPELSAQEINDIWEYIHDWFAE